MEQKYQGVIKHHNQIIFDFQTDERSQAIIKLTRLITEEYVYAKGELIELATGDLIYCCSHAAVC